MPELPEVEIVVRGLNDLLPGHRIKKVEFDWPKSLRIAEQEIERFVLNSCIIRLYRIGKIILIDLDTGNTLIIHLKLTGQLVYRRVLKSKEVERFGAGHPTESLVAHLPDKTTRVIFSLDNQATLFFNDLRKFGWIKILPTETIQEADLISKLGQDALEITLKEFIQCFSRHHKTIKACLLDQNIMAGCGNIYADESLWLSEIHPQTPASKLKEKQLRDLYRNLKYILNFSIKRGGSSSRNYINAVGEKGKYLDYVNVYQRAGSPCKRCQSDIKRIVVASRGTHLCTVCQKVVPS